MAEQKSVRQKYNYEVGLVRHQIKTVKADNLTFSSDGIKFYVDGKLVLSVAPQKWNYIERRGMVDQNESQRSN